MKKSNPPELPDAQRWFSALLLLFVGSGGAALIYEIVWFQLLQLVIGSSATITSNLFSSGDSLPSVIAFQWGEATSDEKRSALIAMGLTLFVLTLLVNFAATFVVGRAMRRSQGTI